MAVCHDKVSRIIEMSSSVIIDPSYVAACAAMNQIVAEFYLPREAYRENGPSGEARQDSPEGDFVERILAMEPTMARHDGSEFVGDPSSPECLQRFVSGEIKYPRMQGIHSFLCAGKDPDKITIVENGPGGLAHVSMILSAMGYHVAIKEPNPLAVRAQIRLTTRTLPQDWLGRIVYFSDNDTIEISIPSHVVYWVNPSNTMFMHMQNRRNLSPEQLANLAGYMGRDVMIGGYLVMQTEDDLYGELHFDENRWQVIFDTTAVGRRQLKTPALPTFFYGIENNLRIFRRTAW